MKSQRRAVIMNILKRTRVHNQEQLRELLQAEGIDVTQATLSRDMRELRLAKVADPSGGSYYAPAPNGGDPTTPALAQLLPALLLSLEGVGPILVVKTPAGSANALASALDRQQWPDIIGCLAGDDTILLITRSERSRRGVASKLRELAGITP